MKIFKNKKNGKLYIVGISLRSCLGPIYSAEPYMHSGKVLKIKTKVHLEKDYKIVGVRGD